MFESWTTKEKIAGLFVLGGIGFVVYEAMNASKALASTTPSQPPVVPTPVAQPLPASGTGQAYNVTTKASDLNVRSAPTSTNSTVIATIKQGSVVQATGPVVLGPGSTTGWLPIVISLPNGQTYPGYVSMDFLTPTAAVAQGQGGASVLQQVSAPQQPVGTFPLYRVQTSGAPAPVYDTASTASQNGTVDNKTLIYGTGAIASGFTQVLDPTSANLIAGWIPSGMLVAQPAAVNV